MVKRITSKNNENEENENSSLPLVIEVTEPRPVILPPIGKEKVGQKLAPGENSVDSEVWEKVKRNIAVKKFLEFGIIVNRGHGKARPISETLDALNFNEAKSLINKEKDKDLINRWMVNSENEQLKKVCKIRLDNMKNES